MVDLGGYVIVLVEQSGKIKLYGSPSERSDCDEILEINGKSLENATHQEIIHHIHQCIRSRTICLRVKRRTSGKLAIDSEPIDAFVIGSRAKEHLQQIARDTTITPRDIAQLSRILSETEENTKLITTTATATATTHESASSIDKPVSESSTLPATQLADQSEKREQTKQKESETTRSDSQEGEIKYYELKDDNMELVELNTSHARQTHRELPVDVPDSFVGIIKQTPRYPPPASLQQRNATSNSQSQSSSSHNQQASQSPSNTASASQQHDKIRKYSEEITRKKAEEEFLRSSLRGSKKLQQLEMKQQESQLQPVVNSGFIPDDEEQSRVLPLPDLNSILERLMNHLNGEMTDAINQTNLAKLIAIYTTIMQNKQKIPQSINANVNTSDLIQEVIILLQEDSMNTDAAELLEILTRFELEGLCYAFDHIAASVEPSSPQSVQPQEEEEEEEEMNVIANKQPEMEILDENMDASVKVVRIEKSSCEPLGATVRNEQDGSVIIGRIVKGGAAEKSGLLHEGDEILEVNGIEMKGRNVNQVCDLLAEMTGTLTFIIASRDNLVNKVSSIPQQQIVHLRALFDYDPDDDLYIPCRELGICFSKGDILHVIDQNDLNWWQAFREGENEHALAGLIPSIQFQMQRETMKQTILNDSTNTGSINNKNRQNKKSSASALLLNCGKSNTGKRKKSRKSQTTDEILTYEEVTLYYPRANIKRPIVLIGPTNIGRHELRQRLMQDNERFAAAIPHTSRPKREGEIDGIDYHFISRTQFEQDIKDGKFVEHGEYEKNYYGTSLSAIESVVHSGKSCVLNLHVHSITLLRQGEAGSKLKPFFVFIAPPTQIDKLNRLISSTSQNTSTQQDMTNPSELQSIINEARDIENRYGHYFDMVLSISDIERSFQELLREINALEREPQWVAACWTK